MTTPHAPSPTSGKRRQVNIREMLAAWPCSVEYLTAPLAEVFEDDSYLEIIEERSAPGGPRSMILFSVSTNTDPENSGMLHLDLIPALAFDATVLTKHAEFIERSLRSVNFIQSHHRNSEREYAAEDLDQLIPAITSAFFNAAVDDNHADTAKCREIFSYLFGYCQTVLVDIAVTESELAKSMTGVVDPVLLFSIYQDGPTLH